MSAFILFRLPRINDLKSVCVFPSVPSVSLHWSSAPYLRILLQLPSTTSHKRIPSGCEPAVYSPALTSSKLVLDPKESITPARPQGEHPSDDFLRRFVSVPCQTFLEPRQFTISQTLLLTQQGVTVLLYLTTLLANSFRGPDITRPAACRCLPFTQRPVLLT